MACLIKNACIFAHLPWLRFIMIFPLSISHFTDLSSALCREQISIYAWRLPCGHGLNREACRSLKQG
ncbi:uncharacterized protein EpC_18630 [Erwinia pyrifoliae Ep1/96]|nr:uncharacterized protein EpC_18630 [Erwinia pyrifoliae Ep1/96]